MPDITRLTNARTAGTLDRRTLDAALYSDADGVLPGWAAHTLAWALEDNPGAVQRMEAALPGFLALTPEQQEERRWTWLGTIAADVRDATTGRERAAAVTALDLCARASIGEQLGAADWYEVAQANNSALSWLALAAVRMGGAERFAAEESPAPKAAVVLRLLGEVERG